jgi:hypothetical protein
LINSRVDRNSLESRPAHARTCVAEDGTVMTSEVHPAVDSEVACGSTRQDATLRYWRFRPSLGPGRRLYLLCHLGQDEEIELFRFRDGIG